MSRMKEVDLLIQNLKTIESAHRFDPQRLYRDTAKQARELIEKLLGESTS